MVFVSAAEDMAGIQFNWSEIRTIHSSIDINNRIEF